MMPEKFTQCRVDGCERNAHRAVHGHRGWCNAHWNRWRKYGDPLGGRTPNGEARRFFEKVALSFDGDECLIWPYYRDEHGYGRLCIGRSQLVSNLVCRKVHGPPPSQRHQASHSCGKGHEGCVSKRHLAWKTVAENAADKSAHGTLLTGEHHPSSKLTSAQAAEIRSLRGTASHQKIAQRFDVSAATVGRILNGERWA